MISHCYWLFIGSTSTLINLSNSKPSITPPTFPTIAVCQVLSINDGSGVIKERGIGM